MAKKLTKAEEKRLAEIDAEIASLERRKKEIEDELAEIEIEQAKQAKTETKTEVKTETFFPTGTDFYKEFMETLELGVEYATAEHARIKQNLLDLKIKSGDVSKEERIYAAVMGMRQCDVDEHHSLITEWIKANGLPELVGKVLEQYPEKRTEIQKRILAFHREGKRLEDSLIR